MRLRTRGLTAATALCLLAPVAVLLQAGPAAAATAVDLVPVSSYSGVSGPVSGGTEITAYDPPSRRAFSTGDPAATATVTVVDVVDLSDPAAPVRLTPIDLSTQGATAVQSVAVGNGVLAVAVTLTSPQAPGAVLFYDAATSAFLRRATVGALPDSVVFTPDGTRVVVANEGEAACAGTVLENPEGSVSIVTIATAATATATFTSFNGLAPQLRAAGVRLSIPGATVAQELEPEYVTVSPDSRLAYVTLQEANAVATVDLTTSTVTRIVGAGSQDYAVTPLDASDQDSATSTVAINRRTHALRGLVMPDGIASLTRGADTLLLLAGEGDARDYLSGCGVPDDTVRVSNARVTFDPSYAESSTAKLNGPTGLARLSVSVVDGDTDGDGDRDQLFALGSRSLRIVRPDGTLVSDTRDLFERTIEARFPAFFNINGENGTNTFDQRSDDKGIEPETVVTGRVAGVDLAFVALERAGGVATLDLTDPAAPALVGYDNPAIDGSTIGRNDRAPEGLAFVPAADAPRGVPLLLVSNEVSGTVTVYEVRVTGAPVTPASPAPSSPAPSSPAPSSPAPSSPAATPTATTSPSATASPSATTSPSPVCSPAQVVLERTTIVATGAAGVRVTGPAGAAVDVLAYTRPSTTYRVVRSGTIGADGSLLLPALRPPANTRLLAQVRGCPPGESVVLNVRTALSLTAVRTGPRTYVFSGDSLPARPGGLIVSLYRVTPSGRQVLTSQTRASATTGEWTVTRRFTGAGRFGFVVRTGQDLQNAPGASNVRSTLVF